MRYYSSTAVVMALTGAVNETVTTIVVDTVLGLPAQTPFTLVVDVGLSTEEIVTVTDVSGANLTVTRGEDSSTAVAHTAGAIVRHMMTARDLREPAVHVAATTYVHGIGATASVVGTDTAQTLTNKTVNFADNTALGVPQASVTDLVDDMAALVLADTNNTAALVQADVDHAAATAAHGATGSVVGTTNAQTLTNKTINFADNTVTGPGHPFASAAGTIYGGNLSTLVSFPAGRFTVAPVVSAQNMTGGQLTITAIESTGFWYQHTTGIVGYVNYNDTLHWTAVQMTPTVAAG